MKLFYASLIQETNTFCPLKTDLDAFRRGYILRGAEIAASLRGTNTEIGGFLGYFADKPVELVPGTANWAVAYGPLLDGAYARLEREMLDALRASLPVDGVLLALHGALVSESVDDCEGLLLRNIRRLVGQKVPIVSTLDYHANITREMLENSDVLVGFRTYPHVDFAQTGERAAEILHRMLLTGERPQTLYCKLPLIVPVEDSETGAGVSGDVVRRLGELDREPDLVSASLFCSQPWLDIAEAGVSLLFYYRGDPKPWRRTAIRLRTEILERKQEFFGDYPTVEQAVAALGSYEKPVVFVDSGDITTAGGIGDSTVALRALLHAGARSALSIVSRRAVRQAFALGVGGVGKISIGGERDFGYNADVEVTAKVLRLSEAPSLVTGEAFSGVSVDTGRRAHLLVNGCVHIVVAEFASMMYDPQFLRDLGVEPAEMDVIVQKSHKLFRAAYAGIAKQVVVLDTPGFTDKNLRRLPFHKIPPGVYPLNTPAPAHS